MHHIKTDLEVILKKELKSHAGKGRYWAGGDFHASHLDGGFYVSRRLNLAYSAGEFENLIMNKQTCG
jgi:hypothetical protein